MAEYLIGMHNHFDENKYSRDYRKDFFGIEFCNLSEDEIGKMIEQQEKKHFKIGIHFPLNKMSYLRRDPLIFSMNSGERKGACEAVEKEVAYASQIGASYLLIHFPKPMMLSNRLKWDKCKFQEYEYIDEADYPYKVFEQRCKEVFIWLEELRERYKVPIYLEIEMINQYLYEGNLLKQLLEEHRGMKLCLDTARLHVLDAIDDQFDLDAFILKYAPYTDLLHLSNVQVKGQIEHGHYPVLEGLSVEAGWGDIAHMLDLFSQENKEVKVLFEHRSDLVSDEALEHCYTWIKRYFES